MKLYATVVGEMANGAPKVAGAGVPLDRTIKVALNKGNKEVYSLFFDSEGLLIQSGGVEILDHNLKGEQEKGETCTQCHGKNIEGCSNCNLEGKE